MLAAGRMLECFKAAWTSVMPRGVSPEELRGVPERVGGGWSFQEDIRVRVDPEVVSQQAAVCGDGDHLVLRSYMLLCSRPGQESCRVVLLLK